MNTNPEHAPKHLKTRSIPSAHQPLKPRMNPLVYQIPFLILALWLFTAYMTRSFPTLTGKRICLVIAHPDDEAMFFAPTLRSLSHPDLGNQILLICFSSGNADGLGPIRKSELVQSALLLGIRTPEHVLVIDDEKNFPDSMTAAWDARLVAQTLMHAFAPKMGAIAPHQAPEANVDVLITFDERGVSGHPNHVALLHGCVAFLRTLMARHAGWENPIKLYTLTSVGIVRKYSSVLDSLASVVAAVLGAKGKGEYPAPLLMVSSPGDLRKAQLAMTTAHVSQMRWFRWGWIGISRYMVVNDLKKRKGV